MVSFSASSLRAMAIVHNLPFSHSGSRWRSELERQRSCTQRFDETMTERTDTDPGTEGRRLAGRAVVLSGAVAGVLDLLAAFVLAAAAGAGPGQVLAAIASGLVGADAYQMGWAAAPVGVALHFAIMLAIAMVFVVGIRRMSSMLQRPWLAGPLYGAAVYVVMQYVVLPLSAYPHPPAVSPESVLTGIAVHMVCVGLPIALITRAVLRPAALSG